MSESSGIERPSDHSNGSGSNRASAVESGPSAPSVAGDPEAVTSAVAQEQEHLSLLYRRLDELRRERIELRDRYVRHSDGTPGGRVERDLSYARHAAAILTLNAAEDRLCFGRLDHGSGEDMHIGRMGIFDDSGDHRQLLMDWRAPSARPFYVATAAEPLGIRRRRYIQTRRRRVEAVTDDYLVLAGAADPGQASAAGLAGEAALLSAIRAPRTGRMSDIVATIQAEQDNIIRADRTGILVVQGGPGTGKTAVALHRAAFLLYTYREQLGQRGVLIIGPNPTFLRYIGQVLPSLGENAVVLSTIGDMFPGVTARAQEVPGTARVKGRPAMAAVIANAVLQRQAMPTDTVHVRFDGAPGGRLRLPPELLTAAQERAWQSRRPHNQARPVFIRRVLDGLVPQVAERLGHGSDGGSLATQDDLDAIRRDLQEHDGLRNALTGIWPLLTPQRLLTELFASPQRIAFAASVFSPADRALLERAPAGDWTIADVPLLDEAAELLGPVGQEPQAAQEAAELAYAGEVLDLIGASDVADDADSDEAPLVSMVSAANLASLHSDVVQMTSTAERAAADREWAFGHVIVDEAQELSPMAWRMVMRRCPVRSMTLVGDLAQTSDPAGASSWDRVLKQYARQQLRVEELTVNYRTPAEIMDVAEPTLHRIDPAARAPRSVRDAGVAPWHQQVAAADLPDHVARLVIQDAAGAGTLAVIVPRSIKDAVTAAVHGVSAALPDRGSPDDPDELRRGVTVLTVREAKGLEFDEVLLADPDGILAESEHGLNDLYVALTRSTQRLAVLHTGPLPALLDRLKDAAA